MAHSDVSDMAMQIIPPAIGPKVGWFKRTVWGYTKDSVGVILPGCTVDLFLTISDLKIDQCLSDATGYYEVSSYQDGNMYIVAYLAGAPDVAGTTVNTLVGF